MFSSVLLFTSSSFVFIFHCIIFSYFHFSSFFFYDFYLPFYYCIIVLVLFLFFLRLHFDSFHRFAFPLKICVCCIYPFRKSASSHPEYLELYIPTTYTKVYLQCFLSSAVCYSVCLNALETPFSFLRRFNHFLSRSTQGKQQLL